MTEQLDFLDLVPIGKDIIEVHVHDDGSGLYWATIGNWWYATGATKQAAIKAVINRYQHECPRLENPPRNDWISWYNPL